MIYIALFAAQFLYVLFPNDLAWSIGWGIHNLTIAVLCAIVWLKGGHSSVAILGLFAFVSFACQSSGITFDNYFVLIITVSILFALWLAKQFLLIDPPNDDVPTDEYVYALAPVRNTMGRFNILSPLNVIEYGGRVLIAGDWIYCVHRGRFKKIRMSDAKHEQINLYKKVRSGVKINQRDSSRLDAKLKERVILGWNDCSTLTVGCPLGYILLKRKISKVFGNG